MRINDICYPIPADRILELPGVAEAMQDFAGYERRLFDVGRLHGYITDGGYLIYDNQRQQALVWIQHWPTPLVWVSTSNPATAIDAHIEHSLNSNELEYEGEGHVVNARGHEMAAKQIAAKMASAKHGAAGAVRNVMYLGKKEGDYGISFAYRAFIGEKIENGDLSGFYEFLWLHSTKQHEAMKAMSRETEAA